MKKGRREMKGEKKIKIEYEKNRKKIKKDKKEIKKENR